MQSREDTLVGWDQTGEMLDLLKGQAKKSERNGGWDVKISEMDASGDHNDLWKDGRRLAEIYGVICREVEGGI